MQGAWPRAPSLPAPGPQLPAPGTALSLPRRFWQHVPAHRAPTAPKLAFLLNSSPPPSRRSCCEREETAPAKLSPPACSPPWHWGSAPLQRGVPRTSAPQALQNTPKSLVCAHAACTATLSDIREHTHATPGSCRCCPTHRGSFDQSESAGPWFCFPSAGSRRALPPPRDRVLCGCAGGSQGLNPSRIISQPPGEHRTHESPAAQLRAEAETSPKGGEMEAEVPQCPHPHECPVGTWSDREMPWGQASSGQWGRVWGLWKQPPPS